MPVLLSNIAMLTDEVIKLTSQQIQVSDNMILKPLSNEDAKVIEHVLRPLST